MNDFTKDELNILFDILIDKCSNSHPEYTIVWTIKDKIQAMINNYCEDVWDTKK